MRENGKYVVGLMSGTSLDGIDAGLVRISEGDSVQVEPIQFTSIPYTEDMKEKILQLCDPESSRLEDISNMNMLLGELFAEAALAVINKAGMNREDISLISSHGQTIYHQPDSVQLAGHHVASTLQIGDISVIAERTGITTVGDFRTRDVAVGGQGAPLVPYADYLLFKENKFGRVLVNIGGISNLTILPKGCTEEDVLAYDTGPGNMIIDAFTTWATNGKQSYDRDGILASKGRVHEEWLSKLLDHPYFSLEPPKSTGRELYGKEYAKKMWAEADLFQMTDNDKIATVTDLTAKSIAQEIEKFVAQSDIQEVLISGGGRYNSTLMSRIQYYLPDHVALKGTEEYGMPSDAKEAIVFALLGYQCLNKKPNNLPSATGAEKSVVMGKIAW